MHRRTAARFRFSIYRVMGPAWRTRSYTVHPSRQVRYSAGRDSKYVWRRRLCKTQVVWERVALADEIRRHRRQDGGCRGVPHHRHEATGSTIACSDAPKAIREATPTESADHGLSVSAASERIVPGVWLQTRSTTVDKDQVSQGSPVARPRVTAGLTTRMAQGAESGQVHCYGRRTSSASCAGRRHRSPRGRA